ncbi:MAG TPA: PEP-CTERM sorting domain-containing protein [Bryobacteraceae bacterium]|nr:PEP-CTERM sorting domain-containing protein [Bryobacteraceae bacterium]
MTLTFNAGRVAASAVAALALTLVGSVPGSAAAVTDPPNDFLSTFNGPHNGDLDVLAANVTLNGSNLDFTATLNGTVGETAGAVYVFGLDRGMGTPKFANIGNPGVIFDSTFVISNTGTGTLKDLIAKTTAPVSDVTLSGATISGVVPVSDLPSEGFSPNNYTFNLWPESGAANAGNTEISDFAPDNAMARVTATPEPASVSLFGMAAIGALAMLRRRKSA